MPSSRRTKTANPENRKRTLDQVNDSVASKRQRLEKLEAECQKQHEQTKVLRADIEKFRSDTLKGSRNREYHFELNKLFIFTSEL